MDFDTAATTPIDNNNQLLLNAIKNKFAAQTSTEVPDFSPPKFDIPVLKVPDEIGLESNANLGRNRQKTEFNQFLLQLREKHSNDDAYKGNKIFVLPQLHTQSQTTETMRTELSEVKPNQLSRLTTSINQLHLQECKTENKIPTSHSIDLTTALSSKLDKQETQANRDLVNLRQNNTQEIDFEIPFIDCDRLDLLRKRTIHLPTSNEYCMTDISQLMLQHSFVEPSPIGRFLCLDNKYSAPSPLKLLSAENRQQQVKHHIVPFQFDTKSPDDLIIEALNKHQRRHLN